MVVLVAACSRDGRAWLEPWARTLTYELHCARARRQCPAQTPCPDPTTLRQCEHPHARDKERGRSLARRPALLSARSRVDVRAWLAHSAADRLAWPRAPRRSASTLLCCVMPAKASRKALHERDGALRRGLNPSFSSATLLSMTCPTRAPRPCRPPTTLSSGSPYSRPGS